MTINPGAMGLSGMILLTLYLLVVPTDIRGFRIPNRYTYPAILAGLSLNLLVSWLHVVGNPGYARLFGGIGITESLLGALLCFSGMTLFFLTLGCGAGDVKLMTAVGCLLGWRSGAEVCLYAVLLAAACILFLILPGRLLLRTTAAAAVATAATIDLTAGSCSGSSRHRHALPMAPFFAAGTLCVVLQPLLLPDCSLLDFLVKIP